MQLVQFVGKLAGHLKVGWHDDHAAGLCVQAFFRCLDERVVVETVEVHHFQMHLKVAPCLTGFHGPLFNLGPVGLRLMFGDEAEEGI